MDVPKSSELESKLAKLEEILKRNREALASERDKMDEERRRKINVFASAAMAVDAGCCW